MNFPGNLGLFFPFHGVKSAAYRLLFFLFFACISGFSYASAGKTANCTVIAKIQHATLQNCLGQNILILEGNSQEMAKAHGAIFKNHLSLDVTSYFSDKVDAAVDFLPSFFKTMGQYLLSMVSAKLHRNMPQHYLKDLEIFRSAANIDPEKINKALAAPDLESLAYSYLNSSFKIPMLGCTSAGKIQGGNLVFGRNLDFAGTDVIDKHSLIVVHKPTGDTELKRAALVADGIHFSGISAFNEAGLVVFVHQNFSSENSFQGLPIMFLIDWLLASARNSDEALKFLEKHRPGPMWTMILVDTTQKTIKAVESSYGAFGVRETTTDFIQTNHLLTPEGQRTQWISYPLLRNSLARYEKASETLSKIAGNPSIESIRQILSYQKTVGKSEPSLYDDIAKPSTVHTVLIEARNGKEPEVWFSRSLAPSSQGSFIKLKMNDFFAAAQQPLKFEHVEQSKKLSLIYEKQKILVTAFKASEDEHDFKKALRLTQNFTSPAVLLYRASLFYQLKQWNEIRKTLGSLVNSSDVPKSLKESSAALITLSHYQQGNKLQAQKLALDYLKQSYWVNNHWFKVISKIASKTELASSDLEVIFDSFSGDIDTPPSHLTVLPDLK